MLKTKNLFLPEVKKRKWQRNQEIKRRLRRCKIQIYKYF